MVRAEGRLVERRTVAGSETQRGRAITALHGAGICGSKRPTGRALVHAGAGRPYGTVEKALCAVPLPMAVSRQIVLQDMPWARRAAILAAPMETLGRAKPVIGSLDLNHDLP